jgi:hypothetical protein
MRTVELTVQVAAALSMGVAITAFKAARFGATEAASAIARRIQPEATR